MIEKAYAKINLALNVVCKRKDKYHSIESIMVPIKLHDSIDIEIVTNKRQEEDYIICDDYDVAIVKYNLCHKAIDIARKYWKFKEHFNVKIHKNIFLQSGLGGGSADAAAVIRAIIILLKLNPSKEEIIKVCKEIGADVPFMFYAKPALVTGVGEVVRHFDWKGIYKDYQIILVKPHQGISTTEVYSVYDKIKGKEHCNVEAFLKLLLRSDPECFNERCNSLEKPGIHILSEVKTIKEMLVEKGFEAAFMTGGGSCVVGLTDSKRLVKKTMKELYKNTDYEVESTTFLK